MHETSLVFAMHSLCRLAHVDSVPNGAKCGCHCPACGDPVIAVNGGSELAHHFRHKADSVCSAGYETMAHLLAKEIIAEEKRLWVPELSVEFPDGPRIMVQKQLATFEDIEVEAWQAGIRPDATARWNDINIGVEIFVTSRCDRKKIARYKERRMAVLELDLSAFRDSLAPAHFREAVIATAYRRWLYHPWQDEPQRRADRAILRHNAEIAREYAVSSGDPTRCGLIAAWFAAFEADAP